MYILFITRGYPTEKHNLTGIFEFDQAKALAKCGHKIVYLSIDTYSLKKFRKVGFKSLKKDGVFIEQLTIPIGGVTKKLLNKIRIYVLNSLYKKSCKKYGEPDIIHSHFIEFGYIMVKVFNNTNIPLVITEHSSSMNQKKLDSYYNFLGKYTYHKADKVIAVSKFLEEGLNKKFNVKATTIPNIVDISNFNYNYNKNINNQYFDFISIGSLTKSKGMLNLVDSFIDAFKKHENVRLIIFGEGILRKSIENIIKENNAEKMILLMGIRSRKVISENMKKAKCFVLASQSETFGVSFIEALASGLPVIATKSGGPNDIVSEKNGLLIEVDNKFELRRALKFMYQNISTYNNANISADTHERYSSINIAKKITELYKTLL